jgi:Fe2+ transport system protein FeoA
MLRLPELASGDRARLVRLGGQRSFRRRLMELGLLPGSELRIVRRVDIGDLLELEVRGCHVSLRRTEARELWVEPSP